MESGLSEEQANRIVVALEQRGISADKGVEESMGGERRFRVEVASDTVGEALGVLQEAELPRRPEPGLERLFQEMRLVPSASEEQAKITAALAGELTRSLEALDGVIDARVHISLPVRDSRVSDDTSPPDRRASVLLKHDARVARPDAASVRQLVSGAIPGMPPSNVAVIPVEAHTRRAPRAGLVQVGPITVAERSAGTLKLVLSAALTLHVILAGAVLVLLRRRRPPAPPLAEAAPLKGDTGT